MKKDKTLLQARNEYIVKKVNESKEFTKAIHQISAEIFISEKTIYRVLKTTDIVFEKIGEQS